MIGVTEETETMIGIGTMTDRDIIVDSVILVLEVIAMIGDLLYWAVIG